MKTKSIAYTLVVVSCLLSCKNRGTNEQSENIDPEMTSIDIAPISEDMLETAIIYEANIRQYSPEGTFDAFTQDIPQLKELGVKIIWLMPVHPISMAKRKAQGDLLVEDIEDPEERKKYLGSYYAVSDYTAVNPEFGTKEDFRELLETAHANGMYVILDWVPNHTGWDHPWITEHPDFYTRNENGEITDPLQDDGTPWGWTDVADLNYNNEAMQEAMIADMLYWVREENIDGFRCDVAHGVPASFWEKAIPRLREAKDIFMLAEAEMPEIMKNDLFEMSYAWEAHHILNALAQGKVEISHWDEYMERAKTRWEADDILMNFITNHDENSWAGTVKERLGGASEAILVMSYAVPGMPLIYSGQEYGLDHQLKFFEKDSIPKTKGKVWGDLKRLAKLKGSYPALNGGKSAASYERLDVDDASVLAFKRAKGNSEAIYVANLSADPVTFDIGISEGFINGMLGEDFIPSENGSYTFAPWEYVLLVR